MKPLKAKIFTYFTLNINPPNELQINQWLAENPGIEIVHMSQSESMVEAKNEVERNLSITILYREGMSVGKRRSSIR